MTDISRKINVGLTALGVIFLVYMVYSFFSDTPEITIEDYAGVTEQFDESEDKDIGMVTETIGIGTVNVARFTDLDPVTKEVEREWGFEKLLHQTEDVWELEKPFMNIFQRDVKSSITADLGRVLVESNVKRPIIKGAFFTGNVEIHITSKGDEDIRKYIIYFDDIEYDSGRSMFSTAGRIHLISEDSNDVNMVGEGFEMVYNEEQSRIESLRIVHLEYLRLRTSSNTSLFSKASQTNVEPKYVFKPQSDKKYNKPILPVKSSDLQAEFVTRPFTQRLADKTEVENTNKAELYSCKFNKNVLIDSPQQLVFAFNAFAINNIGFKEKKEDKAVEKTEKQPADATEETSPTPAMTPEPVAQINSAAEQPKEEYSEVVITCDDGILVLPQEAADEPDQENQMLFDVTSDKPKKLADANGLTTFVSHRIDYEYKGNDIGDILATGPSEIIFHAKNESATEGEPNTRPIYITSQEKVMFSPALNLAEFEGDCIGKVVRQVEGIDEKDTISAPKFTVNLARDMSKRFGDSDIELQHFTASDGVVRLSSIKRSNDELLGGIEFKCSRFDYDPIKQMLSAAGPGIITVDNSKMAKPKKSVGKFSMQKPCWVFVRDFDSLRYLVEENKIFANAKPNETLQIDYFPVVDGDYGAQLSMTANKIVGNMIETNDGTTELATLHATGGVTYEEDAQKTMWGSGKAVQFVGSEFFYDTKKQMITAGGDESQSCLLNGALVDGLEYNLKSGRIKAEIIGPGAIQQ